MNRTLVCNLQKPLPLLRIQRPRNRDLPADLVDFCGLRLASDTVISVNLRVTKPGFETVKLSALVFSIERQGHIGAGTKASQHEIVRRGTAIITTKTSRLIRP